jgi:hypothetical protein
LFVFQTKRPANVASLGGMKMFEMPTPKQGEQLWGIYFAHREYALDNFDPLRAVVAAPTKRAAEEAASRLGLNGPGGALVRLLSPEQAKQILETQSPIPPATTMQPTTAELRTTIEVLKMLGQRINDHADHSVSQLPDTDLGDRYGCHIRDQVIEQSSHIEKVSMQLKNWREEMLQARKQNVSQSV